MVQVIPATEVIPVILCGGSGTRLWPLSRSGFPKQFLVLSGDDSAKSLFQQAVERLNAIGSPEIQLGRTVVVTNEEHRFLVLDQLREIPKVKATLLLEPVGRNTAPALTLAAMYAGEQSGGEVDPILVMTPADQTIQNGQAFSKALQNVSLWLRQM
jgi:mannose-1-phosphate guanylyltransferase/mannose-6-phosphate isomerase